MLYFVKKLDVLSHYDPAHLTRHEALPFHAQRHRLASLKRLTAAAAAEDSGTFELFFPQFGASRLNIQPWSRQKVEPSARTETPSCTSSNSPLPRKFRWEKFQSRFFRLHCTSFTSGKKFTLTLRKRTAYFTSTSGRSKRQTYRDTSALIYVLVEASVYVIRKLCSGRMNRIVTKHGVSVAAPHPWEMGV